MTKKLLLIVFIVLIIAALSLIGYFVYVTKFKKSEVFTPPPPSATEEALPLIVGDSGTAYTGKVLCQLGDGQLLEKFSQEGTDDECEIVLQLTTGEVYRLSVKVEDKDNINFSEYFDKGLTASFKGELINDSGGENPTLVVDLPN